MKLKSLFIMVLVVILALSSVSVYAEEEVVTETVVAETVVVTKSSALFHQLYNKFKVLIDGEDSSSNILEMLLIFNSLKGEGMVGNLETAIDADGTIKAELLNYGFTKEVIKAEVAQFFGMVPDLNNLTSEDLDNVFYRMYINRANLNYFDYASDIKDEAKELYALVPDQAKDVFKLIDVKNEGEVVVFSRFLSLVINDKIGSATYNTTTGVYTEKKFEIKTSTKDTILAEFYRTSGLSDDERLEQLADSLFIVGNMMVKSAEATLKEKGKFDSAFNMALKVNLIDVTNFTPETPDPDPDPTPTPTPTPVPVPVVSISIDRTEVELEVGTEAEVKTSQIDATVFNSTSDLIYTSSDEDIITVSETGLIEAIGVGNATIEVKIEGTNIVRTIDVVVFLVGEEESPLGAVPFFNPYIKGYPDGTFRADDFITRAEVTTIFYNVLDLKANDAEVKVYTDLKSGHWAKEAIDVAGQHGLLGIFDGETFQADKEITRAEVMTMFSMYWKINNITVDDSSNHFIADVKASHDQIKQINQAYNSGLVIGYTDRTFKPEQFTTRAELVMMVNKLLGREDLEVEESKFNDIANGFWAKNAIEAASTLQLAK